MNRAIRPLQASDIVAYLKGRNAVRYTNECTDPADIYIGEVNSIKIHTNGNHKVSKIVLETNWLQRIREAVQARGCINVRSWQITSDELQVNYHLDFSSPMLKKSDGTLIFMSGSEKVEISPISNPPPTELAEVFVNVESQVGDKLNTDNKPDPKKTLAAKSALNGSIGKTGQENGTIFLLKINQSNVESKIEVASSHS